MNRTTSGPESVLHLLCGFNLVICLYPIFVQNKETDGGKLKQFISFNVNGLVEMCLIVKSCYYDDQKSRNIIITESNDLEMTVSENHD